MPVAASPILKQHDLPLTDSSLSRERQVRGTRTRQSKVGRDSVVIQSAKQSYGLEQIVQAVSGAVEGLRDQLEALTILDETALTWPGLSLVLEDLEALVKLLSARACDAEEAAAQLQQDVTAAHAAADRASNDQLASSKQADISHKEAVNAKRELTVVKAELASAKAEGSKHKQRCDDLQSQNATMTLDLKHTQQSLSSTQVKLQVVEKTSTEQASQISTLREELHGSVAELDQVEARLHDKDAVLASLQQAAQVAQRQQAQDRDSIFAGNALRGQLEGQVSSLSRQVGELQEQAAGHAAEVRKLYDWRDVMKTVHNERLQELSNKHQQERDGLLAGISQRDVSIERLKSELASSHEQLDSQTQQLDSLKSSFAQQTAELHKAQSSVNQLQNQVLTAQSSHTRHLSEAAQLRQELRQLSSRLQLAESDQHHLEATCKQTTATAEAEWATKVAEAEKEGAVQQALAQGWQREVALLAPQLHHMQAQLAMHEKQDDNRKQGEDAHLRQQELIALRQQIENQAAELRKVTAEAASQQASSNYLIKHLQSQLQASQAEKDACIQATQKPLQDTGWTVQQATASVARVLKVMSESEAR
ncbi:TPA: hypothetical protein ACH3X2_002392 [Trebouxia sp. C0005]|nr:MAG: hypothetical protein FRX49_02944 [Trebouxia sp. A1-2]